MFDLNNVLYISKHHIYAIASEIVILILRFMNFLFTISTYEYRMVQKTQMGICIHPV